MSYYKYLYSGKQKSTTTGSDENTITHIILAILFFLFVAGILFYANRQSESEALRNERIRRRELANKYYM